MRFPTFLLTSVVVALFAGVAQATLITVTPGGGSVVDFSQFASQQVLSVMPTEVGALVGESIGLTSVGEPQNRVGPLVLHTLGDNGVWDLNSVSNAFDPTGSFTFRFNDGPVASVGGFMNYATPAGMFASQILIEALDNLGSPIEGYNLFDVAPIFTPLSFNAGEFRGIAHPTNDIFAFRVSFDFAVLTDFRFDRLAPVPEPATVTMLGMGIAGLAGYCWRRRSR